MTAPLSEVGPLGHVIVKHPRDAFVDEARIASQWQALGYSAPPDLARAIDEHERFVDLLRSSGATLHFLPRDDGTTIDSLYVRDAAIVSGAGLVLCRMGKCERAGEPAALAGANGATGAPMVVSARIEPPGTLEGGDVIWLDSSTAVVGRGYRTNADGIRQLRAVLGAGVQVVEVPLPHWRGPGDVMHLMSLVSPVDADLAVVYSPLLPVPFRDWLLERGIGLVEVPDEEFETLGANVLALGPRQALVAAGNPRTRAALERAGAEVLEYAGHEISVKGAGGPTCLTRPLTRAG